MKHSGKQIFVRDLSWLSFNARVLQEAADPAVHLYDRLRFLGIFSNNMDEFFRVRVASLNRMVHLGKKVKAHLEQNPDKILAQIQETVNAQQDAFDNIFNDIMARLAQQQIYLRNESSLTPKQQDFVQQYFSEKVRTRIVPLMIESIPKMPLLRDRSIYLACILGSSSHTTLQRYALIEVPSRLLPRFVQLPSEGGGHSIILLEDIIRYNLPAIFGPFGFDTFQAYIIKMTRDAELDLDQDVNMDVIEALSKGLKKRKLGRATRFIYDRSIDPALLDYLMKRLQLTKKDHLVAGGRIHNFKDFMDFPESVFPDYQQGRRPFVHPLLVQPRRIMQVLDTRDVMLHFPYHSFDSVIDLLREAAIDPFVTHIKITCYRLAKESKVINALINAVRNGKQVTVVLELRARFDEEANLMWKEVLEEEGVQVLLGPPGYKVHAKLCLIQKREFNRVKQYGIISTGNFNEDTARLYGDHCLLTANKTLLQDADRIFRFLQAAPGTSMDLLKENKVLPTAPVNMRQFFSKLIGKEIKAAHKEKPASMCIKLNNLTDPVLINQLYEAGREGVDVKLIVRSICGILPDQPDFKRPMYAISIVDAFLEHARVFVFQSSGRETVFISSADWMVRNLDHRIEAACPVYDPEIQKELKDMLALQLAENVKARILDNEQQNDYVTPSPGAAPRRSQMAIYDYLAAKTYSS